MSITELRKNIYKVFDEVAETANETIMYLTAKIDVVPCDMPLFRVIQSALHMDWTHVPFDRLITANASLLNAPLATCDKNIVEHYPYAVC